MKTNPVYRRETTISCRSFRLALILLVFNGLLATIALLNMYSVLAQAKVTAEIQFSSFLDLYIFVAAVEFIMLMFIMPALTSASISGERERQTLDLMLTTNMKPSQIVIGKLLSSLSTMFLLIVSSFPILALVFVYGGITVTDVALLLLCYIAVALLSGSMGLCFSSLFKKSTIATVVTYGVLITIAAGTYAVNMFALSIARMNVDQAYRMAVGNAAEQANSGGFLYTLLLNPVATFYVMIYNQAGNNLVMSNLGEWFGPHPSNFIMNHWVIISITIQTILSIGFLMLAVHAINPVKRYRRDYNRAKKKQK